MSCRLRYEQCCDEPACTKPARYGSLCPAHFQGATPARRAVELLVGSDVLAEFRAGLDNWGTR
jgi:hypothetical protein